jgi:uncharacterized protein (UPF0335 family)
MLLLPAVTQAASDQDLAAMRTQLQALSERLDRLEAENKALTQANVELQKSTRDNVVAVAAVSEKTEAVAAEVKEQAAKTDWTDTIRWQGDFRYRYESFDIEGQPDRNRNRIRARAALIADVTPTIEVGLGMASGGEDPVSSNQTLGGGGSSKGLNLDLAYFDWSGLSNTHVLGGKFKNYLVDSGRNALLWDSDWRPEGVGFSWAGDLFFVNGLGTWIESDSKKEQSFAYATQAGVNMAIGSDMKLVAGIGYYVFDTRGLGSFFGDEDDFFGNSFDPDTLTYLYDYEEIELFAGMGFSLFDRPVLVYGTYVQNQAADENDTAYSFGFKYGKTSKRHDWDVGYMYKHLEADAAIGLLVDSDFGGGGTDAKGHVFKASYGLSRGLAAKFTYFINDAGLKSGDPIDFNRLQLDLSFKYK